MITKREAAIITAYTGVLIGSPSELHKYAEELMGGSVFTSEFANKEVIDEIKKRAKPDFIKLHESVEKPAPPEVKNV